MIKGLKLLLLLTCCLLGFTVVNAADSIQLVVAGKDRAIIMFNNERLVLSPGISKNKRVKLVEATSSQVVITIDGQRHTLIPGSVAAPVLKESYEPAASGSEKVTLWADNTGFFFANGSVNNRSVRFLVDTGANTVTFSSRQADKIGLNYAKGEDGYASTASGVTPMKTFKVNQITVEGIRLFNIRVTVIPGSFPDVPLLGGTFLNRLNMVREGKKMELTKRGY